MTPAVNISKGSVVMDQRDIDFIEQRADTDPELKSLWEDHVLLKKQVEKLEAKPFRSPSEEGQLKQLKKQKLEAKTRLAEMIDARRAQ